jgi:parvulin-like peptidyl-prolyl isomerase
MEDHVKGPTNPNVRFLVVIAILSAVVKAKRFIASVGQQEIPRQDYMAELSHARSRYEAIYGPEVFAGTRGSRVLAQVKAPIATRLVSEHIKLQEVDRSGYRIAAQRVEQAMQAFLNERKTNMADL